MKSKLFSFVLLKSLEAAKGYSEESFDRKEADFKLVKPVTTY